MYGGESELSNILFDVNELKFPVKIGNRFIGHEKEKKLDSSKKKNKNKKTKIYSSEYRTLNSISKPDSVHLFIYILVHLFA